MADHSKAKASVGREGRGGTREKGRATENQRQSPAVLQTRAAFEGEVGQGPKSSQRQQSVPIDSLSRLMKGMHLEKQFPFVP